MLKRTNQQTPHHQAQVDHLLPMRAVIELTSLSKATIYRKVADGTFPRPLKIGKSRVAWREADIAAWISGLAK